MAGRLTPAGRLRPAIRKAIREAFTEVDADGYLTGGYGRGRRFVARPRHGARWVDLDQFRPGRLLRVIEVRTLAQFGMFNKSTMKPLRDGDGRVEITFDDGKWGARRLTTEHFEW